MSELWLQLYDQSFLIMARVSLYVAYKSRIINGVLASYTYVLSKQDV